MKNVGELSLDTTVEKNMMNFLCLLVAKNTAPLMNISDYASAI
jgi:hypothetical protein